jgi:hypothetical protein
MLKYDRRTGYLTRSGGSLLGIGWAGQGKGYNNPAMDDVDKVGPLPAGFYTLQEPHDSPRTGKYTMNLLPDPSNDMKGRSLFRCHGANADHPATSSEGCIVQLHGTRVAMWTEGDHYLQVM